MLNGRTQVTAVIGHPVAHSVSPAIVNAAYEAAGLDWVFVAFDVQPGRAADALTAMRSLGVRGLSVTMPHKDDVFASVDELTERATTIGAVNCVTRVGDRLVGDNTDGRGLLLSLADDPGTDVGGLAVGVIGAGGAARSIVSASAEAGATSIVVVNRTESRAVATVGVAPLVARVGSLADLAECDVIINATSVGMGDDTALAVPIEVLRAGQVVVDIVYHPLDTPLLRAARQVGATAVDGLGMLVGQAALAFAMWTGEVAPLDAMRRAARLAVSSP